MNVMCDMYTSQKIRISLYYVDVKSKNIVKFRN